MDFRSFSNSENGNSGARNGYGQGFSQNGYVQAPDADEIQSKINGLKGKSENELMDSMIKEANRLKSQGKFNALELDEAFERAKGILSTEQLAKLRGLIDMLK